MTITQQEIIALAVEAGFYDITPWLDAENVEQSQIDAANRWIERMTMFAALAYQRGVRDEREACLAEIETGIWMDRTTDEVLADIADSIRARNKPCRFCNGTGERDSGGSQPWGAAIMVECECQQSGCLMVPVEPTRAMLDAARTDLVRDGEIDPMLKYIWHAMVGASQR